VLCVVVLLLIPSGIDVSTAYAAARVRVAQRCDVDEYCNRDEVRDFLTSAYPNKGRLIMGGNRPWELAFDTDNRILPVFESPEELLALRRVGLTPDILFLPAHMSFAGDGASPRGWAAWSLLRANRSPQLLDYALRHEFTDGSLLYEQRKGLPSKPLDYCGGRGKVEIALSRSSDFVLFSEEFHPVETDGTRFWTWMRSARGKLRIYSCATVGVVDRLTMTVLSAVPSNKLRVLLNATPLPEPSVARSPTSSWETLEFSLPAGVFQAGENELVLETTASIQLPPTMETHSVAVERISIE
jgi:hypothetical protein